MSTIFTKACRKAAPARSSFLFYQNNLECSGSSSLHQKFMSARFGSCCDLYRKDLRGHFGCVNAIEFSNRGGEFIVSGGDDRRVLVWNVEKSLNRDEKPVSMKGEHRSNIFCTVFDMDNSHVFSAGNDDQAMRHDLKTRETTGVFLHDNPVYGLNIHPDDNNSFLTACDNGRVLLWDARTGSSPSQCIARYSTEAAFHAAVFNPVDPVLIATANARKGVQLWDVRSPKKILQQYNSDNSVLCAMGVKWNRTGTMLTALRRRLPPVLYRINSTLGLIEFNHPGYNNVCTMKSHCFAGDKDQYIVSGSDDFNMYVWEIPDIPTDQEETIAVDKAFLVLSGHRSIVNQVRFNPATHMFLSAGVEKIVKVWSPWPMPNGKGNVHGKSDATESQRELYSPDDYLDLVLYSGRPLTHEYGEESIEEDPRMLAFFDSLIQHEERGWDSDSDDRFSPEEFYLNYAGIERDREGEVARTVLRRMRHLRRSIFFRGLSRAREGADDDENASAPSESTLQYLRDVTRALVREGVGSSSDSSSISSDYEPRVRLALPENDLDEVPVRFRRRVVRGARRYRRPQSRSSSSSRDNIAEVESSSSSSSTSNMSDSSSTEDSTRRRRSPTSSSEVGSSDSNGNENRERHGKRRRRKRMKRRHDGSNEAQASNTSGANNVSAESSAVCIAAETTCFSHEENNIERHYNAYAMECADGSSPAACLDSAHPTHEVENHLNGRCETVERQNCSVECQRWLPGLDDSSVSNVEIREKGCNSSTSNPLRWYDFGADEHDELAENHTTEQINTLSNHEGADKSLGNSCLGYSGGASVTISNRVPQDTHLGENWNSINGHVGANGALDIAAMSSVVCNSSTSVSERENSNIQDHSI